MTGGAAAPLLGVGTALGVTAACTNLGTSAVEAKLNSNIIKEAERAVEEANRTIQKVKNQINELREVKSKFPSSAIHNVAKASTKSTGAFIIGVSVVFLIVDIIDLNYKVRDIVKNKGSGAARVFRGKANEYEAILK
ncbi:unnamed protein product, partial [Porites evermanni]